MNINEERAELVQACRAYVYAKNKIQQLYPSATTTAEIDQMAMLVTDLTSAAPVATTPSEKPEPRPSFGRVDEKVRPKPALKKAAPKKAAKKPTPKKPAPKKAPEPSPKALASTKAEEEPSFLVDRMEAVLRGNPPMTSRHIVEAIQARGWGITKSGYSPMKLIANTLLKNKKRFVRRAPGLYTVR